MPSLNFEDALRYLFPGLLIFIAITIYGYEPAGGAAGAFDKTVMALGLGIVFYSVYRSIVYDHVVAPMLDCIAKILGLDTYRVWLKSQYKLSTASAENLYSAIRPEFASLNTPGIQQRSALIHFMYQGAIMALLFFVFSASLRTPAWFPSYGLLAIFIILILSAIIADIKIDRQICAVIRQAPEKIASIANNSGCVPIIAKPVAVD